MLSRLRTLFKLNNWKRIFILVFGFISVILFATLSFSLYSKKSSPTTEYKNGIQVTIKPSNEDGTSINDPFTTGQVVGNITARLEEQFPDNNFTIDRETNGVLNLKVTDIDSTNKGNFLDYLTKKEKLVITDLNQKIGQNPFYDKDVSQLFTGTSGQPANNSYTLSFQKQGSDYSSSEIFRLAKQNKIKKIIIWKNFDKLKEIVENDPEFDQGNYNNEYYRYLFKKGNAPETDSSASNPDDPNAPTPEKFYFFKEKLVDKDGKEYKPTDFLVTINSVDDYNKSATLTVNKDFRSANLKVEEKDLKKELADIQFWLTNFSLNNYLVSDINANQGPFAYWMFITAITSFFLVLSIFTVINYGYLGIIAILLLSVITFISLIMLTVFIGDYDSWTTLAVLFSTLIAFDSIVNFCEKIKKEVKKGNSIPKSIKNTIKVTSKGDYMKSFVFTLGIVAAFSFTTRFDPFFALILVSTIIFIPFIMILLLRLLAKVFIGIESIENNGKTVGFWSNKFNIKKDTDEETKEILLEQIKQDQISQDEITNSKSFQLFNRLTGKGLIVSIATFATLLIGGIIVFLVLFFTTESGGFRLAPVVQEQTILRIGNNEKLTNQQVDEVKKELVNNFDIKEDQIKVQNSTLLEVYLANDFENSKINAISSTLISKYNLRVIDSKFTNSLTYMVIKFSLAAIVLALVVMCIFVLFWMKWTKALTLLIASIISVVTFTSLVMVSTVALSPIISTLGMISLIIFSLTNLNSLNKYHEKLKTKRIEEMNLKSIKLLINLVTFKNLKSTLIVNGFIGGTLILFTALWGALPFTVTIFLIIFTILNLLFMLFLLPFILCCLESWKAHILRKRIINSYWDTEKVHEQVFSGINNLK